MGRKQHQKLPSSKAREELREKGQFWTPDWVAEAMVSYALSGNSETIFDPAVGGGAFLKAAKKVASETGKSITLLGTERYADTLNEAIKNNLTEEDISNVIITNFVLSPPEKRYDSIVGNPPYIRHHRIPKEEKSQLRQLSKKAIGKPIDGRAGLHIYFLIHALEHLKTNGKLAFIMPADTCEGTFANDLWKWITNNNCLEAVVTFSPKATPFPNVDTNAMIFFIKKSKQSTHFWWAKCTLAGTSNLKQWVESSFKNTVQNVKSTYHQVSNGLKTGLSRPPRTRTTKNPKLIEYATTMRGIATGANKYFLLTKEQAKKLQIPQEFLKATISRTRDIPTNEVTQDILDNLDRKGRPTLLFYPDERPIEEYPKTVQKYLQKGISLGLHKRSLISTRSPWYKMEKRQIPPILFTYLGRRNSRFIKNNAKCLPLTGFLCVYPRENINAEKLWTVLNMPRTIDNLQLVGKSYGSGAIKVEPRALEQLELPKQIVKQIGITN